MNDAEGVANKKDSTRLKDYLLLIKPSLSIMVVFSSVISYLLAPKVVSYNWQMILLLFAGGMLITGSANAINQVVEKDTDAIMKRTAKRPVAAQRMSVAEGWAFAIVSGIAGVLIMGTFFNWLSAGLSAFSLFLYAFIYTPLKKNKRNCGTGRSRTWCSSLFNRMGRRQRSIIAWRVGAVCNTVLMAVSAFLGHSLGGA